MLQAVIRAVCTILDAFHFSVEPGNLSPEDAAPAAASGSVDTAGQQEGEVEGAAQEDPPVDEVEEAREEEFGHKAAISADSARDITNTLSRRVLPVLQAALVSICKLDLICHEFNQNLDLVSVIQQDSIISIEDISLF